MCIVSFLGGIFVPFFFSFSFWMLWDDASGSVFPFFFFLLLRSCWCVGKNVIYVHEEKENNNIKMNGKGNKKMNRRPASGFTRGFFFNHVLFPTSKFRLSFSIYLLCIYTYTNVSYFLNRFFTFRSNGLVFFPVQI